MYKTVGWGEGVQNSRVGGEGVQNSRVGGGGDRGIEYKNI